MKKLTTPTKLVASVEKFESTRYSIMVNEMLFEYRLKHLVQDVIPTYTAVRPQFLFNGELEAVLLRPLVSMARELLYAKDAAAKPQPGFVQQRFLIMARRYALVAEITNLAGVKSALNVLGDELITASHLSNFFAPSVPKIDTKNMKEEDKAKINPANLLLKFLVSSDNSIDDDMIGQFIAGGADNVIDPEAQADAFAKTLELLQTYAGSGRGVPMSMGAYRAHIQSFELIEAAIASCLDGNIQFSSGSSSSDYMADGYALAVSYLIYLHHSQDAANYDMLFPAAQRSALASTKLAHIANTARRSAWFFAGLSSAPSIFDLVALLDLTKATLKFLDPIMDMEVSQFKDVAEEIAAAEKLLHAHTVSPVQYHCEQILQRIKAISSADAILPNFIKNLFHIPMPVFTEKVIIEPGFSGLAPDFMARFSITSTQMLRSFVEIAHVVRLVRRVAEEIAYTMSSFHLSSEYDPNAMNVPNSLFDLKDSTVSANEISYLSPIHKDILPLSIPRYIVPDDEYLKPKRDRQWILKPYQYATINLISARRSHRSNKVRIVFDRGLKLPIANTIASRFARLPLPMCYVADCYLPSVANSAADVMELIKGNNAGLSSSSLYFDDIASIISSSKMLRPSIANALIGLCRIFHVPLGGKLEDYADSKYTHIIEPTLPFIYGMPRRGFLDAQPSPADYLPGKVHQDRAIAMPISDGSQVYFLLNYKVPKPMPVIYANAMLEDGVMATIPVGLTWFHHWKTAIHSNNNNTVIKELVPSQTANPNLTAIFNAMAYITGSDLEKTPDYDGIMMTVDAWAPIVQFFPHLFYTISDPMWRTPLVLDDLDHMCHVGLFTRIIPGARAMMVLGLVDDYIALIEPSDVLALAEAEDKTLDRVPAVELSSDSSSMPSGSSAGPAPSTGPSIEPAERIIPLIDPVHTGDVRSITSSARLRPGAQSDVIPSPNSEKAVADKAANAQDFEIVVTPSTPPSEPGSHSSSTTLAGDSDLPDSTSPDASSSDEPDEDKKKKKKSNDQSSDKEE